MICQIVRSIDPRLEQQRSRIADTVQQTQAITLGKLIQTYVNVKNLKPTTYEIYQQLKSDFTRLDAHQYIINYFRNGIGAA